MIAHQVRVVRIVGDEHDAQSLFLGGRDVAQHHPGLLDSQRRGGLVENQHTGSEEDRARNCHALPLTAGQRPDGGIDVGQIDAHLAQLFDGRRAHGVRVQSLEESALRELLAEKEVAPHRHQRDHGKILVDRRDTQVESIPRRVERPRCAVDEQLPLGLLVQARHDLDQRGLACAVVTENSGDLTGTDA